MKFLLALLTIIPAILGAQPAFELSTGILPAGPTGGQTMDVAVADLNGDGYQDIVLAKEWDKNVLLLSTGPGTFMDASSNFLHEKNDTEDIAIADFDGNGWLDIVFAAEDNARHEMYLNQGQGNFMSVSERLPSFISNVVLAIDLNKDGFPDLIFGNAGQNVVLINNGSGNFVDETVPRMPVKFDVTQDLLPVDADNDGDLDLALGNEDGNRLLINDGSGIFSDQTATRLPQGVIMETRKVSSADVNGDGYADLYYCNMASSAGKDVRDRLYLNDGKGKFLDVSATNIPPYQRHSFDAVFHDFNNDGHMDLIVGYLQQQIPGVFINDGSGKFIDETSAYLPAATKGDNIGIIVKDMNNDGKADIYLGRFRQQDQLLFRSIATTTNYSSQDPNNSISIFPNPATQTVKIERKGICSEEKLELFITDMNGKEMLRTQYENAGLIDLNLSSFNKETYVFQARTKSCHLEEKIILH